MAIINQFTSNYAMINDMKMFTSWLNDLLNEKNWSNSELARRAGVSQGLVSLVMSEKQKPSFEFCARAAKALRVSPVVAMRKASLLPSGNETPIYRELIDLLSELSIDDQQEVLAFALFRRSRRAPETYKTQTAEAST